MRSLRNIKAFTIIQVLVGAFIASIVALGVAQMLTNSKIQARKINLLNTLKEQKARIEFLLRDQTAFDQTINGGLNTAQLFVSLRASSPTAELDYATAATKLVIYDSSGAVVYNMVGRYDSGVFTGNGLTEKGNPCANFDGTPGSGNDDCPISYRILIGADCPNGTTCSEPQLKIVARLLFNPKTTVNTYSQLKMFKTLIPSNASQTDSIANTIVDGRYDAVVKRTASSIARSFKLAAYFPNTNASSRIGGCRLAALGWDADNVPHPLVASYGWVVDYDPHSLVSAPTTAGTNGQFSLRESGYFNCYVMAPAFAVGGFSIRLRNVTAPSDVGIASSIAPPWSESFARLDVSFNNTSSTNLYTVQEMCDANTPTTPANDAFELGVGRTPYNTPIAEVIVSCSKVDNAF